ncbi:Alanine--tRNA ligase, cytoplasmic [Operophtera brumata]|uniref:alanine--tRNA ligase n=1 Tax=Operophtera brumata TaxID=104452 RepID=A0A0L7LHS1_OPEBR|nr:Alanine--tRNA ligase, cytoplasmic [Operophtera brumata]
MGASGPCGPCTEIHHCNRYVCIASSRLRALGAKDNFWEMGASGPCGPCTEIHHVNPDGSLTEIWNLVFIQCNRYVCIASSRLRALGAKDNFWEMVASGPCGPCTEIHHRMAALLQGVPTNYDTDLFQPLIRAIEQVNRPLADSTWTRAWV